MASVFLSYDRDDAAKARAVARALEKAGHSVWWDRHVKGGAQYSKEIELALKAADAVVVLWSAQSVESAWVRDEAAAGRDSGRLVPVLIGTVHPPLGFRQYQSIDLSRWKGRSNSPPLQDILGAIAALADGEQDTGISTAGAVPPAAPKLPLARIGTLLALVLILATAAFLLFRDRQSEDIQTVAVAAAEPSAEPLARDLLVKLGTLQSAKSGSMRLVSGDRGNLKKADLLFEIGGDSTAEKPAATLVLTAGSSPNVLWSADLVEERGGLADLKQRAAFTSARVLGCVLDTQSQGDTPLTQDVLKVYLNACALLGDNTSRDSSQIITSLENVIQQAPGFNPAWAKLLVAQTSRYQGASAEQRKEIAADFRRRIAEARNLDPTMPEAYLAELELVPAPFFSEQIKLADQALKAGPDNPLVLSGRSLAMLVVGRTDAAVDDARSAKSLDPLSPSVRFAYVEALAVAGRIDAARSELEEAEKLWPGASTISSVRFVFHFLVGDPRDALRLIRSGAIRGSRESEALLEARINPTKPNVDRSITLAMSNRADSAKWLRRIIETLGEFNRKDELFTILLGRHDPREIPYFVDALFQPAQADLRADPRFMLVASRFGLLDYWRRSGDWPDFCADPDLPYDCKIEGAKLAARPSRP